MLNYYKDIALIHSSEIIGIVRNALSKIDPRLIDHGERVGFIAEKIYRETADKAAFDFTKLFILCVLHDIGAYKTDEIDDMVQFETVMPYEHCLYGYVFLKNTAHLNQYAEALLYHHTDYATLKTKNCLYSRYAEIIHLADRADILIQSKAGDLSALKTMAGTKFNPQYVEALFSAEEKYGLSD